MISDYPFNPYDWTTLSPLFQALLEAPIADGGFMPWLEAWNQLDIAIWDAYTQLKRPAYYDTSDQAADQAYRTYVQHLQSTYVGLTDALIGRALSVQLEPPIENYAQLWLRWRNQRKLFDPANLPILAEISPLDSHYREIMNQCDANDPTNYWLGRREELNDLMLRLLHLRRKLAENSGLPNFLHYRWREMNRLGYSITECQDFHRAVEQWVVPIVAQLRAADQSDHPSPEIEDLDLLVDGCGRCLQQIDPQFGALFQAMRTAGHLDLGSRPNKASAVEEWFFPHAGLPHLQIVTFNAGSVFHESGHGMHDYLSFQTHGSIWNLNGPEEFQEFAAMSMDLLAWPYYRQSQGGPYTDEQSIAARQHVLHYYLSALTDCTMQDAFEHWVYGEAPADVTPADLDAKWIELKQRFTPWENCEPTAAEAQTGWQRWNWSLFRMPLYLISYPMAVVATCQFGRAVEQNRETAIRNYKAALRLGNTRSLSELFSAVGVPFPFSQQAVEAAIQFIFEQQPSLRDER